MVLVSVVNNSCNMEKTLYNLHAKKIIKGL